MTQAKRPTGTNARLIELVIGAAVLLGLASALTLVDGLLGFAPIATATLGGLAATVVAGRAGVVWDRADPEGQSPKRAAGGTFLGVAIGSTVCFAALVIAHLVGWGSIKLGHPAVSILLSLLACIANSVREEVLLRGIPMYFARRAGIRRSFSVAFAALLSPTSFLLASGTAWPAVVLAIASGFLSARLFDRTGSLWAAVGANAAAAVILGPMTQGGILDVAWWSGELSRGRGASGAVAITAAVLFALAGLAVGRGPLRLGKLEPGQVKPSRRSPRSPRR